MPGSRKLHMAQNLRRRILRRAAKGAAHGEKAIVLTLKKDGSPSVVYGLEEYLRKSEIAKQIKPWKHRKKQDAVPDPLGAVDGKIIGSLSRSEIYDE